jgi:proteic killer suppression protein
VIRSFKHAGLERFFRMGSKAGIQPNHAKKMRILLTALDAASNPQMMDGSGWGFHALSGALKGHWALSGTATGALHLPSKAKMPRL